MKRLQLRLMGGFEVQSGLQVLPVPTRKAQALLAYLALTPGDVHPRDKLAAFLWPDAQPAQARNALRQTLFVLRKALGPGSRTALALTSDAITLTPGAMLTDVAAFEEAVREGTPAALERAAVLYRGDLLAGVGVAAPLFEDWLMSERERLRELVLEALARLLAHQRAVNATAPAVQSALRLLSVDPLQEAVHRTLMRLYVLLGRRDAALRQYQTCVDLLRRELAMEPEAETQELYREILRRPSPAVPSPSIVVAPSSAHFVGRNAELGWLRDALGSAWTVQGGVIAVLGEAGIGKSRLLAELAADAGRRGGLVLLGSCYESEQILPFGPWVSALRNAGLFADRDALEGLDAAGRAELSRLVPELQDKDRAPGTVAPHPLRLFEGLAQLIRRIALARPLAILLEDVHWADEMTLRFLGYLARRLGSAPILLALSARREELADRPLLRAILDELGAESRLARRVIGRLGREDTVTLARLLAGAEAHGAALRATAEQVWQLSAGNPFVILETMRAIGAGVRLESAAGAPVPATVREMITRRLGRLSAGARELVHVGATIGRQFDFTLLRRAAGVSEVEAAAGVEELVRREVIHDVGERFDFTHDLIRTVATQALLPARRQLLHAAIAAALEDIAGDDVARHASALGAHYREAGCWPKAVRFLRQAGVQATERCAYREAVVLLEQTLEALQQLPQSRAVVEDAIDVRLELRNALLPLGELPSIVARLEEAASLAEQLEDRPRQVRAAAFLVNQLRILGEHDRTLREGARALAVAESLADPELLMLIRTRLGQTHHLRGEYRSAVAMFRRNLETATPASAQHRFGLLQPPAVHSRYALVLSLMELGAIEEARAIADDCMETARRAGHPLALSFAWASAGNIELQCGELAAAKEAFERALELGRGAEESPWAARFAASLGYAYALSEAPGRAVSVLTRALEQVDAIGMTAAKSLMLSWLAEARLLAGDTDGASRAADEAVAVAERHGERGHLAWALRTRAQVHAGRDATATGDAAELYARASALADELEMRPLAARCRLGLGVLLGEAGDSGRARAELLEASDLFAAMGLASWLREAQRALRAA